MRPLDGKSAATLRNHGTTRRRSVTPIDRRREIACRRIGVGVGKSRYCRPADRCAFGAGDSRAAGSERCVGDRRATGGAGRAAADVINSYADLVGAFVGVRVTAVNRKAAAVLRDNGAGRAGTVAPIDGRGEIAQRRIRIGVGEGRHCYCAGRFTFGPSDARARGPKRRS